MITPDSVIFKEQIASRVSQCTVWRLCNINIYTILCFPYIFYYFRRTSLLFISRFLQYFNQPIFSHIFAITSHAPLFIHSKICSKILLLSLSLFDFLLPLGGFYAISKNFTGNLLIILSGNSAFCLVI